MKKGIILLTVLLVVILVFFGQLLWNNKKTSKEIYSNKYNEKYEVPDNWRNEETLQNKVSIKNTEKFDVAVRVSFEEKLIDQDGNTIDLDSELDKLIEKKIYDENWIQLDGDSKYYYYSYGISKNEEINLNQYLLLDKDLKDIKEYEQKKYIVITNIEMVQYDRYIETWNLNKDNDEIKLAKSHDDKKKFDEDMKAKEEEMIVNDKIDRTLSNLSLEEKIGQMMIISLHKNADRLKEEKKDYNIDNLLSTVKPGGVIVETTDFKQSTTDEMINLTGKLKESSSIPMIISIDQEGGRVQRLRNLKDRDNNGIAYIPAMSTIAEKNDLDLAYDVGRLIGMELNVFGFNMDFAPVIDTLYVDSNVIGDRSFGNDKELVAKMGLSLAGGLQNRGIVPVYKHFPNHGSTSLDSHDGLPNVNKTKEELKKDDLYPFMEAINNNAPVIMIGHLYYPEISDVPSSLSKEIINDLLKEELGFDGIVVTDSLRMGAIIKKYGEKEVYEMAINAGVDVLLMPYNPDSTIRYIKQSIEEGKITEEQINNSVRKILRLKYTTLDTTIQGKDVLASKEYKDLATRVSSAFE